MSREAVVLHHQPFVGVVTSCAYSNSSVPQNIKGIKLSFIQAHAALVYEYISIKKNVVKNQACDTTKMRNKSTNNAEPSVNNIYV